MLETKQGVIPPIKTEIQVHYKGLWRAWFGALLFLGCGALLSWGLGQPDASNELRAVLALFVLFALALGGAWVATIRMSRYSRSREPALVINQDGLSARFASGGRMVRYRVPWSEITGCSVKTHKEGFSSWRSVELRLRAPTRRFQLPPKQPLRFSRAQGRLGLPTPFLDISSEELASLIQSHLDQPHDNSASV